MKGLLDWAGHGWLALAARWYLGFVFLFACLHKIAHPEAFAVDVATYGILPLSLVNLMAVTLPWLEFSAGVMLVSGLWGRAAALMAFGMMVMFTVALAIALSQGLDMACGCFASEAAQGGNLISGKTVLRDLGWLALAVYVALFDRSPMGVDRILARRKAVAT